MTKLALHRGTNWTYSGNKPFREYLYIPRDKPTRASDEYYAYEVQCREQLKKAEDEQRCAIREGQGDPITFAYEEFVAEGILSEFEKNPNFITKEVNARELIPREGNDPKIIVITPTRNRITNTKI